MLAIFRDALNRLTQKTYSDSTPPATYLYDVSSVDYVSNITNPIGRLVKAASGCAVNYHEYDQMGRITLDFQQSPVHCANGYPEFILTYGYDLLGNTTSFSNGEFVNFTYGYNGVARLTSLTSSLSDSNNPPNLLSAAHYNAFGGIISDTLGDTETETFGYDKRMRLQSTTSSYNGTQTYSFGLTFAPNGDVTAANDSVNSNWNYKYDEFNRLTCSNLASNGTCAAPTNGTPTYSYAYDRFGNRWSQAGPHNFPATFTGNNPGNPQNNNRLDGYTYDAAGNLLNDKTHAYAYDAENRIIQVDGGATATYSYDADGRRAVKTTGTAIYNECDPSNTTGGTVYYLYDQFGHAAVYTANGVNQCKDEIYAGGRHLATVEGGTVFIHTDWLGTDRVHISYPYANNRAYDQHCTSLPFGDGASGCVATPYTSPLFFTGKERDPESGLDNFGARYYGSNMGRFMSVDPTFQSQILELPQTWNRYTYVYNRPLFATDPDGRCPPCIGAIIGGVVEGGFDLGKQLYQNGGKLTGEGGVKWREVGANVLGGAVSGALAGATGGATLFESALVGDVVAGGVSNVVGGVVTRTVEGDNSNEVLSPGDIAEDAVAGFVGGGAGHIAGDMIHVPEEPMHNGRNSVGAIRRDNAKFGRYNSALNNQIVRSTVASSATTHSTNGILDAASQAASRFWHSITGLQCVSVTIRMDGRDIQSSSTCHY